MRFLTVLRYGHTVLVHHPGFGYDSCAAGICFVEITALGGAGGSAAPGSAGGGAAGAAVTARVPVTAGGQLPVEVGGAGSPGTTASGGAGGVGGGSGAAGAAAPTPQLAAAVDRRT